MPYSIHRVVLLSSILTGFGTGRNQVLKWKERGVHTTNGGLLIDVIVSGARVQEREVTPSQTPVPAKSNLDSFVTAEECLRQFPQRLKESFRVK